MEVEMKAPISVAQAKVLIDSMRNGYHISRGGGWRPFRKRDTYYSFNGEFVDYPINIIRIREECEIGDDPFEAIILGRASHFKEGTNKTFLTVKTKNTDEKGIETNGETENWKTETCVKNVRTNYLRGLVIAETVRSQRSMSSLHTVRKIRKL